MFSTLPLTIAIFAALSKLTGVYADWKAPHAPWKPFAGTLNDKPTADIDADAYAKFVLQRGNVPRLNYLLAQNNTDLFKFNFNPNNPPTSASNGAGGLAVLADRSTMPALIDRGVAMGMGFMEPCGVQTPHHHPFATQLLAVAAGGPLKAGAIWANKASSQQLYAEVNAFEMIMLPQGTYHYYFNDNCERALTASAFGSDDPGILNIAQTFFKFDADILNGTLGYPAQLNGASPADFSNQIPPSYVLGSEDCLKRCGISKDIQGTPP